MTYETKAALRNKNAVLRYSNLSNAISRLESLGYKLQGTRSLGATSPTVNAAEADEKATTERKALLEDNARLRNALKYAGYEEIIPKDPSRAPSWDRTEADLDQEIARLEDREARARRNEQAKTLNLVIEALQLREYGYRKPGTVGAIFGEASGRAFPEHERLHADLTTALEVRKHATQAKQAEATEKRVSGLTEPKTQTSFTFQATADSGSQYLLVPHFGNPEAPTVADLHPERKATPTKKKPGKK